MDSNTALDVCVAATAGLMADLRVLALDASKPLNADIAAETHRLILKHFLMLYGEAEHRGFNQGREFHSKHVGSN